jgi:hypothetical protein
MKPFWYPDAEAKNEEAQRAAREHFDDEYRKSKTGEANARPRDQSKQARLPARVSSIATQSANGPRQAPSSGLQRQKGETQGAKAKDVSSWLALSRRAR